MRKYDQIEQEPIILAEDLPSYKVDFSESEYQSELERVLDGCKREREWIEATSQRPFKDNQEIASAIATRRLTKVSVGAGYITIRRLRNESRDYSQPYIRPHAKRVLEYVAKEAMLENATNDQLSITSLVRSSEYQNKLSSAGGRVIAMPSESGSSSHEFGWSFDIDACGMYVSGFSGGKRVSSVPVNPRNPELYNSYANDIAGVRASVRGVLDRLADHDIVNFVEEAPWTREHCFHVCVNPKADLDILQS